MLTELIVAGNRVRLDPAMVLGKGGEADVYRLGDKALKVFKTPDHPDIVSLPPGPDRERLAREARQRIATHQTKLAAFPKKDLPSGLIAPVDLATDRKGAIYGYTMPLIVDARELMALHDDKGLRKQIAPKDLVHFFLRLRTLVAQIHKAGIIIADFNDLNVLIQKIGTPEAIPMLVDADSMQFGNFLSPMFTARFVDPMLCDPAATKPMLIKPHTTNSDWFAFLVMLFESLLWTGPYGGVHKPKEASQRIAHDARSLRRASVLGADVIYPKPARSPKLLPDELLQFFLDVFEKDRRGEVEASLLENLRWTKCNDCGFEHARRTCPQCGVAAAAIAQHVTVRGKVTATRLFPNGRAHGRILQVAMQDGKLVYLYEEGGQIRREDATVVFTQPARPEMRLRISGTRTLIGLGGRLVAIEPGEAPKALNVDTFGHKPMFDTTAKTLFRLQGGQLVREGNFGIDTTELIGNVLSGQTVIWTGPAFGFGFYRAGALFQAFVFNEAKRSLNDSVNLPPIPGQLVDAHAVFSSNGVWFFTKSQHLGNLINRCTVLAPDGKVIASHEATDGDGSWLSDIRGGCAVTLPKQGGGIRHVLFVPTDEGIVCVDAEPTGIVQTRHFADTEPFVDASSRLFYAKEGIYVIRRDEIHLLKMS